jgi:hypothetical protein
MPQSGRAHFTPKHRPVGTCWQNYLANAAVRTDFKMTGFPKPVLPQAAPDGDSGAGILHISALIGYLENDFSNMFAGFHPTVRI